RGNTAFRLERYHNLLTKPSASANDFSRKRIAALPRKSIPPFSCPPDPTPSSPDLLRKEECSGPALGGLPVEREYVTRGKNMRPVASLDEVSLRPATIVSTSLDESAIRTQLFR